MKCSIDKTIIALHNFMNYKYITCYKAIAILTICNAQLTLLQPLSMIDVAVFTPGI